MCVHIYKPRSVYNVRRIKVCRDWNKDQQDIKCDISTYQSIPVVQRSVVADVPSKLPHSSRRRRGTHFSSWLFRSSSRLQIHHRITRDKVPFNYFVYYRRGEMLHRKTAFARITRFFPRRRKVRNDQVSPHCKIAALISETPATECLLVRRKFCNSASR